MNLEIILALLALSSTSAIQLTKDNVASTCQVKINEIDCSSQMIDTIAQDTFVNYGDKIVTLSLRDNLIRNLEPGTFSTLTNLKKLNLDKNKLKTIPVDLFGLENSLETLIMTSNSIPFSIDLGFSNPNKLKFLDLSENQIWFVKPSNLGNLENLETLILRSCTIKKLDDLFNSTNNKLKILNMDNGDISVLGDTKSFAIYTNLEELSLQNSSITLIDPTVFSSNKKLVSLDLSKNRILKISEGTFQNLTRLVSLELNDNGILSIPAIEFYCSSSRIQYLDLCGNKIQYVDPNNCNDISKLYKTWEQWYGFYPAICSGLTTNIRTTVSTSTGSAISTSSFRTTTTTVSQAARFMPDLHRILLVCLLVAILLA